MNNYDVLRSINMQGGLDVSSAPLSQASQNALGDGTWNAIVSGNGYVKPWGGATSQGAGTGSYKMMPFGNTWGGIKSYQYVDKTFVAPGAVGTNQVTVTGHGYVTGLLVSGIATTGTLPTGLSLLTEYYVIVVDANTLKFATSLANALLGTAVSITTTTGTGTATINVANSAVTASGNWMQDIGLSRWGIGSGQPMIAGAPVPGYTLSTNLQVQIPSSGVFGVPVQAGLSQPSAPGLGIINTVGSISNSMSAKIARSRPATGAVSVASPTSVTVNPQANKLRLTFPVAATGQTHWRAYFTQQGFGGTGIHYLAEYYTGSAYVTDIPEATVAAGTAAGARATGTLTFNAQPAAGETIDINGVTFEFIAGASTGTQVNYGTSAETAAANLVAVLNASGDGLLTVATYTVVGAVVTITYDTDGVSGNAFTLADSSAAAITRSDATLTGGVAGISRSLEFNFKDGDLIPLEASYDDYAPPAGTHAIRLNTVMNVVGCYSDQAAPTSSNTGTAIAVSKENNYEAYVPTSLLYLPEQVVDVLARPIDDYGYVGLHNSIQAIQYVGNRGDELPSCTITTVLPDIGIQYPHNWCAFQGRLLIYPSPGVLMLMEENGGFDTSFANPVTAILKTFPLASTAVGYDGRNDSIVVMCGKHMLVYSRQAQQWRQIWLPDFGSRKAMGTFTFTINPSDSQTIVVNGVTFTFVAALPTGNEIAIQPTLAQTVAEAVSVLNASVDASVSVATYAVSGSDTILVTYDTAGTGGNSFALNKGSGAGSVSAATLLGGVAGIDGTCLASCTTSGGVLYFSMTNGGVETAYTYDTAGVTAPISFVCNPQNAGGVVVNDVYEMAVAAWTTVSTKLAVAINKNLTPTAYRQISITAGSVTATDAESSLTSNMIGKQFILFAPNIGGYGTVLLRGTISNVGSVASMTLSVAPQVTLSDCLMFVGDFAASENISAAQHLPNFFPNMPELRSFQVATWMQATGDAGNVLTVDLLGATYASSRAL